MKKKNSRLQTLVVMIVLGIVIVGGYYLISQKEETKVESQAIETEVDKLLSRNLETDYPATPREVVKLYSRLLKALYNEELAKEDMVDLNKQVRLLYDEELIGNNEESDHLSTLEMEVEEARGLSKSIVSVILEDSKDVITWVEDGREYARMIACYTIKEDVQYTRTYEEFALRKDEKGRYKIIGWRLADSSGMD